MLLHYLLKCIKQKSRRSRTEWSELPCKTQPLKTIHRIIVFTDKKDIHSDHIEKPAKWPTVCISINKNRRCDKPAAYTNETFCHLWHKLVSNKWLTLHQPNNCGLWTTCWFANFPTAKVNSPTGQLTDSEINSSNCSDKFFVSDIAIFVLKRDVKLQLTNLINFTVLICKMFTNTIVFFDICLPLNSEELCTLWGCFLVW